MEHFKERFRKYFPLSFRDLLIYLLAMGCGAALCSLLQRITTSDVHVPTIFVLVVLVIALLTRGYFFGILAAISSVFAVNWAFTYPYMKLDFSVYGYPLTFITMLGVGLAASTLMTFMKERNRVRAEAEQEKMRANLLRSVSHDLRTPLTAISGSIGAVLDRGSEMEPAERRELLENARSDADWLYRMVENLLSVTRISGTSEITLTEELLEEVLSEAVVKFRKRRGEKIEVRVTVPEEALFVPMDAMLIEQVLLNLMDNAAVHGGHTSLIELKVEELPEEVAVSVLDNGKGINPKRIGQLLEGRTPEEAGLAMLPDSDSSRYMGIGLAVCRTILDAHGGTIRAENRPEGGAAFTFTLKKGAQHECEG